MANIDLKNFIVPTVISEGFFFEDEDRCDIKDLVVLNSYKEVYEYEKNIDARKVSVTDWALVNRGFQDNDEKTLAGKIGTAAYWLRSNYRDEHCYMVCGDGDLDGARVENTSHTIRPFLHLGLSSVVTELNKQSNIFKFGTVEDERCKVLYHTLNFGEYPKNFVGESLNLELESKYQQQHFLLNKTGKKYLGRVTFLADTCYHDEYVYNGQKFVRVPLIKYDFGKFSDGSEIPKNGEIAWIKVEPITWKILNWEDMPREINPYGNGSANFLKVIADQAIAALPFYPNIKPDDVFCNQWQNSLIRAYLNGYDLHKEIENGNGIRQRKAYNNFDFTKQNFLTEAFVKENVEKMKKGIENDATRTKRKGYGVKILDRPLSTDEQIKFYIEKGKSFMFHGPSGVGKTRRIEEVDPEFVSIVLRNGILPEEVIGKTIYLNDDKTKSGKWVAPAWYQDLCEKCQREPNKNHVLFIDEITNVKPSEQSLVFHLVLNNSIGPNIGKLPDNVVVVAAGNSKEESESAYNMPEPLFRRFDAHIYLRPDIQEWLEWGSEKVGDGDRLKIHPLVSSFVASYGQKVFYSQYDSEEPPKFAIDPRGWEQVSDIIYDNDESISLELVENKVGKDIASAFVAFAKTLPITVEDVMEDNYGLDEIPINFDAKYALAMSLRNADFEQIKKVRQFVGKYLGKEILATFDSIWVEKNDDKAIFLQKIKEENQNKFEI